MLIVAASQTKVLLALSPEEFSELIERARVSRSRRRVVLTTGEEAPVPASRPLSVAQFRGIP
jgi:hypothetical protein